MINDAVEWFTVEEQLVAMATKYTQQLDHVNTMVTMAIGCHGNSCHDNRCHGYQKSVNK